MSRTLALPSLAPDGHAGRRIGNNELICRLASGGMAEIFLAVRRGEAGFRKLVVVKRILPQIAQQGDLVARLLEEGKLMAGFSHPAIAQVFDLGRDGEDYFIVMEYVPGVTLRHLMRAAEEAGERLPAGFTVAVGKAVAEALHHAHGHSIIHRDVAPKNVMVSFAGDPKLLDFGVAKGVTELTAVGMVVGTPSYMSPEQVSGQALDGRSDEFSLSATLHACLTGKDLFGADNVAAELEAVMRRAVPPTSPSNPEVSAALDDVLLRGLARPREERFPTARDFARALEAAGVEAWGPERVAAVVQRFFPADRENARKLLESLGDATAPELPASQPEPLPTSAPVRRASARAKLLGIGGALVVLALSAYGLRRGLAQPPTPQHASPAPVAAAPAPAAAAPIELPSAPPADPPAPPPPSTPDVPRAPPARRTRPSVAKARPPAQAPAPAEAGSLWVRVRPWARVYVDGKPRGETPLDPFPIAAGRHTVLLVNDQLAARKTYDVDVRPHEQTEVKSLLDEK